MNRSPLWLLLQAGDAPAEAVVLYTLAHDAGLSWRGGWMPARTELMREVKRGRAPRTSVLGLAARLGMCRQTIGAALRALIGAGKVVRTEDGRLEPTQACLARRWAVCGPRNRSYVRWEDLADPRLTLTAALLAGKLAKVEGCGPHMRYRPTIASLASELLRCGRTIARAAARLLACGAKLTFVRGGGRRGFFSLLSGHSEGRRPAASEWIRTDIALRKLMERFLPSLRPDWRRKPDPAMVEEHARRVAALFERNYPGVKPTGLAGRMIRSMGRDRDRAVGNWEAERHARAMAPKLSFRYSPYASRNAGKTWEALDAEWIAEGRQGAQPSLYLKQHKHVDFDETKEQSNG